MRRLNAAVTVILLCAAHVGIAQSLPPIRQITKLERASTDSLASATTAIQLRDGRVLLNDLRARRVVLFDSTLAHATIVADTTGATSNAYGNFGGTLIPYRGDSSLFIAISSLSMNVITPDGALGRVLAIPRADDAQRLLGNIFGVPGFDASGRLIYRTSAGMDGTFVLCCVEHPPHMGKVGERSRQVPKPDTGLLIRVDLGTRVADTLTSIKVEWEKQRMMFDENQYLTAIERIAMPYPLIDAWAFLPDGTLAVIRGSDYHVDWLSADGKWTSTPKIPFAWQRNDDARKQTIIDSSAAAQKLIDARMNGGRGGGGAGVGGGRGGAGASTGRASMTPIPAVSVAPELSDIPDYVRPFDEGAVHADREGHLWIRTTALVDSRPVYDVVNRRGELIERVQLPAFRSIVGFGPGVIYLGVTEPSGKVRLERARVH